MNTILATQTASAFFEILSDILRSNQAYLDPGSGSYLLQLLIAGLLGGALVIRSSWDRIKSFFRRGPRTDDEASSDDGQS